MLAIIQDETLRDDHPDFWENDEIEMFFDGDNSKNRQDIGFDDNDLQLFCPYNGMPRLGGNLVSDIICAHGQTTRGRIFETAIPQTVVTFPFRDNFVFGFSIFSGDNDGGSYRQHVARRWATGGTIWLDPSLWGDARLDTLVASETLSILKTKRAPAIDGQRDDCWLEAPLYSHNRYLGGDFGLALPTHKDDLVFDFQVLWDEDYLYAFIYVIDDTLLTSGTPSDEIWLFFHGENPLSVSLITPSSSMNTQTALQEVRNGYLVEAAIPFAELGTVGIGLNENEPFGFEVRVEDADDINIKAAIAQWWSDTPEMSTLGLATLSSSQVTHVENRTVAPMPRQIELYQNYPNPFNPATTIEFALEKRQFVSLEIFNLQEELVETVISKRFGEGSHTLTWNAAHQPSGLYLCRLQGEHFSQVRKMLLVR